MNEQYQASGQNKPAAAKWLWITLIIVVLLGGAFAAWYYLIGPGKAVESSLMDTTTPATIGADETADWKTYTNTVKNFSFKYPKDWTESTDSTDKTKVTTPTVRIIVEKISDIGSVPLGYDTTTALKDQTALKNNDPSTPIAQAVSSSYKMLKITGAVGKEFVILGQIDATDVQLVREAMIYTDDGYRIRIMADYNNDVALETNNSSYFKADASSAENLKVWNTKDQFYTDLVAGKTDSLTQTWYKNFTTSLSTFKFTAAAASATTSTADWKTYTNSTYGLSFKYPKDWNFETLQNGNEISFSPIGKTFYLEGTTMGVIRLVVSPDVTFNTNNYKNAQQIQVGSKTGYRTTSNGEVSITIDINNVPVSIANDVNVVVANSEFKDNVSAYNTIFDQIISTFQFTK